MKWKVKRVREVALVLLVALTATLANLPEDLLERFDINRDLLLGTLALTVVIALFLYLKFQFFFLVVLLAVAANMPGEIADSLGISTTPLIIAMAPMVGFSLINYIQIVTFLAIGTCIVALLYLRRIMPDAPRPVKVSMTVGDIVRNYAGAHRVPADLPSRLHIPSGDADVGGASRLGHRIGHVTKKTAQPIDRQVPASVIRYATNGSGGAALIYATPPIRDSSVN